MFKHPLSHGVDINHADSKAAEATPVAAASAAFAGQDKAAASLPVKPAEHDCSADKLSPRQRLHELKAKAERHKSMCLQSSRMCSLRTALVLQRSQLQLNRRSAVR